MKLSVISAHAHGHIDPTFKASLLDHLPETCGWMDADAVLVVIGYHGEYLFNKSLMDITRRGKPVVIIDLMEYFGFLDGKTHLFGVHDLPRNMEGNVDWHLLSQWASATNLRLYFKREYFGEETKLNVAPIEWPCVHPAWEMESKEAFDKRPFQVFYNWGYSNSLRPRMASEIYGLMADGDIEVVSAFDHIDAKALEPQHKWISIHSPHTHRTHINEILRRQAQSKCSISMPGSGSICFRHTEAPVHTIPVYVADGIRRSIPWMDGRNCITLDPESDVPMARQLALRLVAESETLHGMYVAAQETIDRYRTRRYLHEYVLPAIHSAL